MEILEEIIQGIEIVYPTQESMAIFLDLMNRYQPKGLKVHDLEIISIGLANGVSEIATFNTKDFKSVKEISLTEI
jgi:predicted nucleic acid-binding protein